MNVTFENVSKVQALLSISLEKADYQESVNKALKDAKKKINMPGFRPGMVPMALVQKMYGKSIKADEINKILQEKVYNYIKDNKIEMLGEPLPNDEKESGMNIDDDDMTFYFDIALAPQFEAEVGQDDTVPYYEIEVTDAMVDGQLDAYKKQNGSYVDAETYQANDVLKGNLVEMDETGDIKQGGIEVEDATLMPDYFKDEEQKKLFENVTVGHSLSINPVKAYDGNEIEVSSLLKMTKEEAAGITSDFMFTVKEITRFEDGELNQELFDRVCGKDVVTDEVSFRAKVQESLSKSFVPECDYKFMLDLRTYMMKKVGKLEYADELLKRIMKSNKPNEELKDEDFNRSLEELTWHLIKEKLVEKYSIKIDDEDVKAMAREATRAQFAQYGMMNIPDDLLDNYAKEMLKKRETVDNLVNRAIESKLSAAVKEAVKLENKKVSVEEFNQLFATPAEA